MSRKRCPGNEPPGMSCERRRSEEHTSELQSQSNLVCRLLLEKKKKTQKYDARACSRNRAEKLDGFFLYGASLYGAPYLFTALAMRIPQPSLTTGAINTRKRCR